MKLNFSRMLFSSIWGIIIFFLSSLPNILNHLPGFWYTRIVYIKAWDSYLKLYEIADAIGHFLEYFILFLLISWSIDSDHDKINKKLLLAFTLAFFIALVNELIQLRIPGRGLELSDLVLDVGGIIAGFVFWNAGRKKRLQTG